MSNVKRGWSTRKSAATSKMEKPLNNKKVNIDQEKAIVTSRREKTSNNKKDNIDQEKALQMIRERAYFVWEEKGRPEGQEWDAWFEAEKEILAQNQLAKN